MTSDIKSLCCLTKAKKPATFLHFFMNTAKGSVLFQLTVALILCANAFIYGSSAEFAWGGVLVCFFFFCGKHKQKSP